MRRVFLTVMLTVVAGCVPRVKVKVTPLNAAPRPAAARPAAQVEVYTTALPGRPYVEVALLQASGEEQYDHYGPLRERAGGLGCDALVMLGGATVVATKTESTASTSFIGKRASTSVESKSAATTALTATCVMWAEPTTPPASPSGGPPGATR